MAAPRDGPNPLRPYYIPPSVGPPPPGTKQQNASTAANIKQATAPKSSSLGSSARDMLSDLDYSEYLPEASPSVVELLRGLVDRGLWTYTSVLLAQPFDVAKTVLQVQLASEVEDRARNSRAQSREERLYRHGVPGVQSDDSGDDSSSYFTSAVPLARESRPVRRRRGSSPSPPSSADRTQRRPPDRSALHPHALPPASSLTAVLSHLWASEGAWGVWKGTNSTFVHSVLLSSVITFLRSLLCAVLALPDPSSPSAAHLPPDGLDILSSPSPLLSLFATTTASALASILLSPVDISRTKLMLTPSTHPPRSLLSTLRSLPSWTLPPSVALATLLHGALPTFISASVPLIFRAHFGIDPVLTPSTYAFATFASQAFELAIRLPVETVLRRGQMAAIRGTSSAANTPTAQPKTAKSRTAGTQSFQTVVEVGPYSGLIGTMYHIAFEEGNLEERAGKDGLSRSTGTATSARSQVQGKKRKGQGVVGLYRGWRVGVWGLIGVWGAAFIGGGGKGGEF